MADRNFSLSVTIEGIKQGIKDFADLTGATKAYEQAQNAAAKASKTYQTAAAKTKKVIDDTKKALTPFGKLFQAGAKGGKIFAKGLRGVGKALGGILKASGVGAVIAALTGAFKASQPVMDAFAKAGNIIQIVFQKLSEAISPVIEKLTASNESFDATKEVIGSLLTIAIQPLIISFNAIKLAILQAQKVWENSWLGGKDQDKIAALNEEIEETKQNIIDAGKTIAKEAGDVVENFGEAVSEVVTATTEIVTAGVEAVKNLDIKEIADQAGKLVELQKAAARADLERQKIQLEYQKTQEELRQDRDDETKNLSERIKANQDLLDSQIKQAELEKEQIRIKIAAAAAENEIKQTEETRNALAEARLELAELDERITGQRSEALTNQVSLEKEQLALKLQAGEIDQATYEAEQRRLAEAEVNAKNRQAAAIQNANDRAQAEFEIQQEYLQKQLDLEKELFEQQSQATNDRLAELEEAGNTETQEYIDLLAKKAEADQAYADTVQGLSDQIADNEVANSQRIVDVKRAEREQILEATAKSLGALAGLAEQLAKGDTKRAKKAFQVAKALNLAEAVISTYAAITKTLKEPTLPFPANVITAVGIGAQGLAQVLKIRSQKFQAPSGGDGGGGEAAGGGPSKFAEGGLLRGRRHSQGGIKTSFGELEGGEFVVNRRATQNFFPLINSINESGKRKYAEGGVTGMSKELEETLTKQQPVVKTYVVASDMSSQQEADKRIKDIASL